MSYPNWFDQFRSPRSEYLWCTVGVQTADRWVYHVEKCLCVDGEPVEKHNFIFPCPNYGEALRLASHINKETPNA